MKWAWGTFNAYGLVLWETETHIQHINTYNRKKQEKAGESEKKFNKFDFTENFILSTIFSWQVFEKENEEEREDDERKKRRR